MLNVPLASVDAVARPVLAIGTDYPPDTLLPTHVHRRAQFLYGMSGLMEVQTQDGSWVIPPGSGGVDTRRQAAPGADARGEHPQPVHRAGAAGA